MTEVFEIRPNERYLIVVSVPEGVDSDTLTRIQTHFENEIDEWWKSRTKFKTLAIHGIEVDVKRVDDG